MESSVQAAYARLGRAAASALSSASGTSVSVNTHGYAIGTNYAEAGLALVGENGPELMMMQGGEKILTAAETRALQEEYIEAMMFLPELFKQLRGYAGGTDNAAPALLGWARMGRGGPRRSVHHAAHRRRRSHPDIPGHGSKAEATS
jgi:SLT domain-containing protein